jgi:predicted negative regulator of RcsB-dependent stress response
MADEDNFDSLEQSERARAWFQNNGSTLLMAVLGAMAVIWGYKGYQANKIAAAENAGAVFEKIARAAEAKKDQEVSAYSAELRKNHGKLTYAALGSMAEAKYLAEQNKIDVAITSTKLAQEAGSSAQIKNLASLRLARLQIASGKSAEAVTTLNSVQDEAFKAVREELRGDALVALGKLSEAKEAYSKALTATDLAQAGRPSLQQKLDNLNG